MATMKEVSEELARVQKLYEATLKDLENTQRKCASIAKRNVRLKGALAKLGGAFSETDAQADYLRDRIAEIQSVGLCRIVIKTPYVYCYFSDGTSLVQRMEEPIMEDTISAAVYANILKKLIGVEAIAELSASLSDFVRDAAEGAAVSIPQAKGLEELADKSERRRLFEAMGYVKAVEREGGNP